ncbi:MAG: protein kinase [Leptospiraceae bacterium]|nr:protein kinase [Leptospiraceae bacterium]
MALSEEQKKEILTLIHDAQTGGKYAIARLISELEKKDSFDFRKFLFSTLKELNISDKESFTFGFTGTPGAGKSSLIGALCEEFLQKASDKKLAIVAIDPSSHISGGSILGDRTRVTIPARENRIFFRSQPSQLDMGGINPYTYHVVRLLRYFFDYVIIETVGIGQNEIEVSNISDFSFLILQPLGGDQIQFMKSGIMEVPDAFIINKCDEEELAKSSYYTLESSLAFLKDILGGKIPRIFLSSATKKLGIDSLFKFILEMKAHKSRETELILQLKKWLKTEYGQFGLRIFENRKNEFGAGSDYETTEEKLMTILPSNAD